MSGPGFDPRSLPPQRRIRLIGADVRTVLVENGLDDLVTRLDGEIGVDESAVAAVVVAGETKRGKSSLVNALLARPGLSPVGSDVATNCFISFLRGGRETAFVIRDDQPSEVEIAVDQLAEWVTVEGNPSNARGVRAAYVYLDAPALQGCAIVDTPGVGGLDAGHGALTMQALARADAMIFVIDAGAPVTVPEIDFLAVAAERVDTVIVALTKVDAFPGWKTVAEDNKALFERRAPRFASCPWVPVSSRLALQSISLRPEAAAMARQESGVSALEDLVEHHVIQRANLLRVANGARLCLHALERAAALIRERMAATLGPPELLGALEAEQRHLAELGRHGAAWRRELEDAIRLIGLDRAESLRTGIGELRNRYTSWIEEAKPADLEVIPDQLLADIAALADDLAQQSAKSITARAGDILGQLDQSSPLYRAIGEVGSVGAVDFGSVPLPGRRSMSVGDHLAAVGSLSTGRSIETIIGGAVGGLAFLGPIGGIGVGLAFWALRSWGISKQAKRGDLRVWVAQQLSDAQAQVANMFSRGMIALQSEIGQAITDHLLERQRQISASLDARKAMLAETAAGREAARSEAQRNLQSIARLRERAERLLEDISASQGAPVVARGA
jgi:Dynamin family